jgi:hypothetical protein
MNVPDEVREKLRDVLWRTADETRWMTLSPVEKSKYYRAWTRDPEIGGVLARYLGRGQIRVYIKDSLLKDYARARLADEKRPFRILGLLNETAARAYTKPHGRLLKDGRVVCWGKAEDWKSILIAAYERAYEMENGVPYAAVLMHAAGRFHENDTRKLVERVGEKLGIAKVVWLDT